MLLIEIKKRDLKDVNKRTLFEQNCLISSKRILNVYILLSVALSEMRLKNLLCSETSRFIL